MVKAYLADSKVMIKNKHHVTFDVSIRVFVYRMQTPVIPMPASPCDSNGGDVLNFSEIKGRFEKAQQEYDLKKKEKERTKALAIRYRGPLLPLY